MIGVKKSNKRKVKIGIPRALLYYKFFPMWTTFFEQLGTSVVVSQKTNKTLKDVAVNIAPDEDCYSTKLYFGHVMALKNKVDYLFIPRFSSGGFGKGHEKNVSCPKFIGLADVLRSLFPSLPEIIKPYYSTAKNNHGKLRFLKICFSIGSRFTKNPLKIIYAMKKALKAQKEHFQKLHISIDELKKWERSEIVLNEIPIVNEGDAPLKVAIVGHSYVLNDAFQSVGIIKKLTNHGVDYITSEQMPRELIEHQMDLLESNMYFEYEREILGTIMHFLESKTIDGILHLIIFSCGPDSINGELASRYSRREPEVPLLQLVIDEHTGEAGLNTRIEAFIDMLRRRKSIKEKNRRNMECLSPSLTSGL
ncbi:MAG: acyl-CoA dehydratase activase-related protein [Promethearchaeota archaeon]